MAEFIVESYDFLKMENQMRYAIGITISKETL